MAKKVLKYDIANLTNDINYPGYIRNAGYLEGLAHMFDYINNSNTVNNEILVHITDEMTRKGAINLRYNDDV